VCDFGPRHGSAAFGRERKRPCGDSMQLTPIDRRQIVVNGIPQQRVGELTDAHRAPCGAQQGDRRGQRAASRHEGSPGLLTPGVAPWLLDRAPCFAPQLVTTGHGLQ
jgi:hypothetical protein